LFSGKTEMTPRPETQRRQQPKAWPLLVHKTWECFTARLPGANVPAGWMEVMGYQQDYITMNYRYVNPWDTKTQPQPVEEVSIRQPVIDTTQVDSGLPW
jgi:hypothetical protein